VTEGTGSGLLGGSGRSRAVLAGILVIGLACGALLWPGSDPSRSRGVFLVFDSSGNQARVTAVFEPLQDFLGAFTDRPLDLQVVPTLAAFRQMVKEGVDFVLCPDGLALDLPEGDFVPVAVGRRAAPRNLRPRSLLVYRKAAGLVDAPWLARPGATVCGDSVSLSATGKWRLLAGEPARGPATMDACAWGPDPYDHAPALHAARLGGFDYALVRQWDADRFFAAGLLSPQEWGREVMTMPVPDIVLFAARSVGGQVRLEVGNGLASLGRQDHEQHPLARDLQRGIAGLNLVGFNLLVDPDFDLVRRNFARDWPPAGD
jgi:hypothetical protein